MLKGFKLEHAFSLLYSIMQQETPDLCYVEDAIFEALVFIKAEGGAYKEL